MVSTVYPLSYMHQIWMADRWHLFLLWQLACCFVPYAIWWSQRAQCCYPDTGGRVEFVQDSNFSLGIQRHLKFSNLTEKSDSFFMQYSELKSTLYSKILLLDLPIIWMTNRNQPFPLLICTWILKFLVWKIKFNELDFFFLFQTGLLHTTQAVKIKSSQMVPSQKHFPS